MSHTRLIFKSSIGQEELECFINLHGEITIIIKEPNGFECDNFKFVSLDASTSIKLAKTIRTHINKIKKEL